MSDYPKIGDIVYYETNGSVIEGELISVNEEMETAIIAEYDTDIKWKINLNVASLELVDESNCCCNQFKICDFHKKQMIDSVNDMINHIEKIINKSGILLN